MFNMKGRRSIQNSLVQLPMNEPLSRQKAPQNLLVFLVVLRITDMLGRWVGNYLHR